MGRRRVLTALLALALALTGTVLLTRYVRSADDRALATTTTTSVLVVTSRVPQGTPIQELAGRVKPKKLPTLAVVPGAMTGLGEAGDRVTAVDLQPGEQLLAARLVDPATLKKPNQVTVPAGLQEVAVALEPQRMLQTHLAPGDVVGVMISLPKDDYSPAVTELALQKVLVTRVGDSSTAATEDDKTPEPAPGGSTAPPTSGDKVMVTLAVDATDAQKVVFGAEHGSVWLSRQPADVPTATPTPMTREELYR